MKFLKTLLIAGLFAFAGIHFASNFAVAKMFEKWLGVPVSIQSVRWGLASHQLQLKHVKIKNPPGYQPRLLADIPVIRANYDASELRKGVFKISHLEVEVDEVWLESKSASESNVLALKPMQLTLGLLQPPSPPAIRFFPPISVSIEKVTFGIKRVVFQTRLGNDDITESRTVESSKEDLTELTTPDRVLVYGVLLALRSAGWQSFLPTKDQAVQNAESRMNAWVEQIKQKAQVLQAQIQQALNEKFNKTEANS